MRNYASLYSLLLDDLGFTSEVLPPITSDMDDRTIAKVALAGSFYKKLAPSGDTRRPDEAALKKFIAINSSISDSPFRFPAESEVESLFYDYFKDFLAKSLLPRPFGRQFDLEFIREHMGPGPGAAQKADSSTFVSKLFESPMSYVHEDLIPIYRAALSETGLWADAEMQRFQKYGFVRVRGGRIFFAPKNAEESRTCCTEASLEIIIQKAIGAFLELVLVEDFGISLSRQPDNNRRLARIGSVDGSFGTIDLVSASDSIGYQLFLDALPNCPLKTMMKRCRSEFAVLPSGEEVELRMVSTMGNGFTFPLQTIMFASAVRAVYTLMGFPSVCPETQYGVFGDDIIVRREAYEFLIKMLVKLGFKVNVGKSFNTGSFRESCGSDFYAGYNVRGVYIRSLETPQEVYSAFNRLTRWSAYHAVPLTGVLSALLKWVRFLPIPPSEADDAGICVPYRYSPNPRVSNRYWYKYRCNVAVRKKVELADDDTSGGNLLGVAVGWLAGVIRRREPSFTETEQRILEENLRLGNPAFSDLQGPGTISLRNRVGARTRYKVVTREIPYWDYWPPTKRASSITPDIVEMPKLSAMSGRMDVSGRALLTRGSQEAWEGVLVALLPFDR